MSLVRSFTTCLTALGLWVAAVPLARAADAPQPPGKEWKVLFNGENLDGWKIRSGKAKYRVEDGAIVGTTVAGSPNTFLISDEEFADFELRFEVLLDDNELNSGVQIRSKVRDGEYQGRVYGPQVEIEASPGQAGYIYGEAAGGWQSPEPTSDDPKINQHSHFKNQQWNEFRVRAVGRKIETWINGHQIADLTYDQARYDDNPRGVIGLQVHGVGDRGPYEVRWRNLFIKPLEGEAAER
ncbi:3-keto-disaccharide hydrolase [Candidatus Laterigemmans baculatus]|uniref:3-keto-disaccharide hydrolase n=1 Tax=Candidatus Laterigemmans baculatus TaxID=2770505 RepID=UPI0013D8FD9F|nr:DUF1080 domain-containing protein [Candidatus Laterigemmans baculatus]